MRKVTISCLLALMLLYSNNAIAKGGPSGYYEPNAEDGAEDILEKYPNWPDSSRCAACHFWQSPSSANLNPFGQAFQPTHNLSAVAGGDADGDGRSNGAELSAGTLPGLKSPPPGGVAASDGTYTDKVRVSWGPAVDTPGWMPSSLGKISLYSIYRALESAPVPQNITTSPPLATASASQTSYDDQTAVAGTKYRYWVSATSPGGQSETEGPAIGMAKAQLPELKLSKAQKALMNPKMPQDPSLSRLAPRGQKSAVKLSAGKSRQISIMAPGHISASDGTYSDKIRVTWGPVPGAVFYRLLRSEGSAQGIQSQMATPKITTYDDKLAKPGTKYFYRIISCSAINDLSKCSPMSSPDSGYKKSVAMMKKVGPSAPAMQQKGSTTVRTPGQLSPPSPKPGQLSPLIIKKRR